MCTHLFRLSRLSCYPAFLRQCLVIKLLFDSGAWRGDYGPAAASCVGDGAESRETGKPGIVNCEL